MSTKLLDLEDRIITDTGAMVAKHDLLVSLALDGKDFSHLPTVDHPDIRLYHAVNETGASAKIWEEDDNIVGPDPASFGWATPPEYARIDIDRLCIDALTDMGLIDDETYVGRLTDELDIIQEKDMGDFFRCLVWITDTMRVNDVVWGLGRGSSCASLVLYLIGVNKVDPVKYDINMVEFYK